MREPKRVVQLDYAPPHQRRRWFWNLAALFVLSMLLVALGSLLVKRSNMPAPQFPPGGNPTGSAPAGR